MKTKPRTVKPMNLTTAQARRLLDVGELLLVDALREQPPSDDFHVGFYHPIVVRNGMDEPGPLVFGAFTADGEWGCPAPYQPGDVVPCRERWGIASWTGFLNDPCLNYESDGKQIPIVKFDDRWILGGNGDGGFVDWQDDPQTLLKFGDRGWQPASTMPLWAVRLRPVVKTDECRKVCTIGRTIAERAGFSGKASDFDFAADWHRRYSRRGEAYSFDRAFAFFTVLKIEE